MTSMADGESNLKSLESTELDKTKTKEVTDQQTMKIKDKNFQFDSDNMASLKDVLTVLNEIKENKDADIKSHINTVEKIIERININVPVNSQKDAETNNQEIVEANSLKRNEEKLNVVMAEYEKAISKLVRDNACILKERDTFQVHLANVEAAFSDVHQKYERCKSVIEGFKNNETILKETIRANEEQILKQNNKYDALKTHAMGQLEKANNELVEIKKNYEDEIIRLKATIQKLELQNGSLKQTVDQRTKECEELTRICDDLITKVGR